MDKKQCTPRLQKGEISRYFIDANVIQSKQVVKDLGVLFDSMLKEHIQNVNLKAMRITAMAYRFSTETRLPVMSIYIHNVYNIHQTHS